MSNADLVICCWLHHSCIWPLASSLHSHFCDEPASFFQLAAFTKELNCRARRLTQTPTILARCSWSIFRDKRSCVLGLYHNRISQLGWDDSQLCSATCIVHGACAFLGLSLTRWHKICGWSQIHVRIAKSRWVHRKTATLQHVHTVRGLETKKVLQSSVWSDVANRQTRRLSNSVKYPLHASMTNHSLFHWNTLTQPELLIRIWISSKRNASMVVGISMDQEICPIHGQVSHNLLYSTKRLLTDICGPGWSKRRNSLHPGQIIQPELWKSTGKHAKLKEKKKWSAEELHLENERKLRGIYFLHSEETEFKETIKNARKKLETSVAPAMPCIIMKNCGSGASNKIKNKTCVYSGSQWIHKNAYGEFWTT